MRNSGHPEYFWTAFDSYRRFYGSAREGTLRAAAQSGSIAVALERLREIYPSPPIPVTIGVGRANSAGRGYNGGIYLSAEMFTLGQGIDTSELPSWAISLLAPPEAIVPAAIHEAVHTFQPAVTDPILLVECLREGAASYVAEWITKRPPSPDLHAWCQPRAKQLFREFARQAGGTSYDAWLRNATEPRADGRPPDIGYWIGYEIVRDFHRRARDKRAALRDIIDMHDPRALVRSTSYRWLIAPPRARVRRSSHGRAR